MRAAKGEELRLAIARTGGRCAFRSYSPGLGQLAACGRPAALAVHEHGAGVATAACESHYRLAMTGGAR